MSRTKQGSDGGGSRRPPQKKDKNPRKRSRPRDQPAHNGAVEPVAAPDAAAVAPPEAAEPAGVLRFTPADVLGVQWFWSPWIGRGIYTLLVGSPGSGKSTMLAHLCGRASRSIIMPGEEDVRRVVLPRLLSADVDLRTVSVVPSSDGWYLPLARSRLIGLIERERAELVVIDPLDSYLSPGEDENGNLPVRRILQALQDVAESTQAAIIAVRHPGKAIGNLLAGSRAWRSHPRAILQMVLSPDDDRKGIISILKAPFGVREAPHWYAIHGADGQPTTWTLEGQAPIYAEREAGEVADRVDRSKIGEAVELLEGLLAGGEEMDAKIVYATCERYAIKERTVRYAAERLGVHRHHEGLREDRRVYWRLPPPATQ